VSALLAVEITNNMEVVVQFKVIAKRYGDTVEFYISADDIKDALVSARVEAHRIFGSAPGDSGAPTVSVKPVIEKE